jgi:hypothetical protein
MKNIHQMVSGAIGFSAKVPGRSIIKNERWFLQMHATKFHIEPETETESGVRLNLVIRDLVIMNTNTTHGTQPQRRRGEKGGKQRPKLRVLTTRCHQHCGYSDKL